MEQIYFSCDHCSRLYSIVLQFKPYLDLFFSCLDANMGRLLLCFLHCVFVDTNNVLKWDQGRLIWAIDQWVFNFCHFSDAKTWRKILTLCNCVSWSRCSVIVPVNSSKQDCMPLCIAVFVYWSGDVVSANGGLRQSPRWSSILQWACNNLSISHKWLTLT